MTRLATWDFGNATVTITTVFADTPVTQARGAPPAGDRRTSLGNRCGRSTPTAPRRRASLNEQLSTGHPELVQSRSSQWRRLAKLLDTVPGVSELLLQGRISVAQAHQLARACARERRHDLVVL
jgi:hypothetical protein